MFVNFYHSIVICQFNLFNISFVRNKYLQVFLVETILHMFLIKKRLADAQYFITNFMVISCIKYRGSHLQMFFKIGVLKNFAIFVRKHLCWILFSINWPQIFYCEYWKTYFEKHHDLKTLSLNFKSSSFEI